MMWYRKHFNGCSVSWIAKYTFKLILYKLIVDKHLQVQDTFLGCDSHRECVLDFDGNYLQL